MHSVHLLFSTAGEAQPLKKAPQWMKRPCGVSFGFGGRLVSFANHKTATVDAHGGPGPMRDHGIITVSQVRNRLLIEATRKCAQAATHKKREDLLSFSHVVTEHVHETQLSVSQSLILNLPFLTGGD